MESSSMGFGGDLKLLVGFDAEGKVLGYTVLQHSETPGAWGQGRQVVSERRQGETS